METEKHENLKSIAERQLKDEGYEIIKREKRVKNIGNNGSHYTVDVAGYIGGVNKEKRMKCKAVECGHVDREKLLNLNKIFDEVEHIPYENRVCGFCGYEETSRPNRYWYYDVKSNVHVCPTCYRILKNITQEILPSVKNLVKKEINRNVRNALETLEKNVEDSK